ncbi:MAG: hypothetical protein EBR02_06145 [Alphaproteobacteria bacterium]|nr:hypothetical protein [Alphaproteobacteria bacterium]
MKLNILKIPAIQSVWKFLNKETGVTKTSWMVWGFFVFLIPFQLHYNYILNAFYHFGAGYGDAGLFAQLIWHGDWKLTVPGPFGNAAYSFLAIHFSPILILLTQLSYFIPTHMVEYDAAYISSIYALFSVALFAMFYAAIGARNHLHMMLLAAVAILFAFNSIIMNGLWYVHIEYGMPAGILLFLLCYVKRWKRLGIFFFIFTLLVREDGGFHLTAILGLIGLLKLLETRKFSAVRREAMFIALAFTFSIFAWVCTFLVIQYWGGRGQSTWELMYAGKPAYAHLSFEMIWERLTVLFRERIYLWLGFYITICWAVWKRNAYYALGFCAYIPWFLLHLTAVQKMAGELQAYYPFPFLVALGWPMLAVMFRYGFPLPRGKASEALILQILMVAVGLMTWNSNDRLLRFSPTQGWGTFKVQRGAEHSDVIRQFMVQFNAGAGELGSVMGDSGALALLKGEYKGSFLSQLNAKKKVDTLLYMSASKSRFPGKDIIAAVQNSKLPNHYCMGGASICMFTNRSLEQLGTLAPLFGPVPVDHSVFEAVVGETPSALPSAKKIIAPNKDTSLKGIDFNKLLGGGKQKPKPAPEPAAPTAAAKPRSNLDGIDFNKLMR